MTKNGVKHRRKGKARHGTDKEENKNKFINEGNLTGTLVTEGFDIEDNSEDDKTKKTQKMSPDVSCF